MGNVWGFLLWGAVMLVGLVLAWRLLLRMEMAFFEDEQDGE